MRSALRHFTTAAVVLAGAVVCAAIGESAYWWYVGEDGVSETGSVLCFAAAGVFAIRARFALSRDGRALLSWLFLLAGLALFFLAGEEISWGQRIFGWATPERMAEANVQGETTLHNISGFHEMMHWAQLALGAYGVFLPLVVPRLGGKWIHEVLPFVVPPARFIPYFLPIFLWRLFRSFFELPEENNYAITQINEVLEFILSIGLFLFFYDADRRARTGRD